MTYAASVQALQRAARPPRLVTDHDGEGLRWLEVRTAEWIEFAQRRPERLPRGPLSPVEVEL